MPALDDLPPDARRAWLKLRDALVEVLGDELVAIWAYGSMIGSDRPQRAADLDTHVIVRSRSGNVDARHIEAALSRDPGVEFDVWFITLEDARRSEPPPHAFLEGRRDTAWAVHRAHWLAGRFITVHGLEPAAVVQPPAWDEVMVDLDRELEHIERHVQEGDNDPYEAAYAVLNGSRILRTVQTHDPVLSKREAGRWAVTNLPGRWRSALDAALRAYDERETPDDATFLAAEMAPFVAMVREQLPRLGGDRTETPRWSGY